MFFQIQNIWANFSTKMDQTFAYQMQLNIQIRVGLFQLNQTFLECIIFSQPIELVQIG